MSEEEGEEAPSPADVLRALIVTDNHLGYAERDPVIGDDSFTTFEEILQAAQELDVDCILHGGDLFHLNKPSRKTMVRTIELLRKYTLGDKPFPLQLMSDVKPDEDAPVFSWLSPEISSCMPIIGIHGNHDDRAGDGAFSAVDLLSQAGLYNYIGKSSSFDKIEVSPVILRKGDTQVAVYGLGHVRDERLHRMMSEQRVNWLQPQDEDYKAFNVALVHQNRVSHTSKGFVDVKQLPDFLDLIVWGHEHDCQVSATQMAGKKGFITQPGSSVATSLMEGEAKPKHVALLEVHMDRFQLTAVPLHTVRPMIVRDVSLRDAKLGVGDEEGIQNFLRETVEQLLTENKEAAEKEGSPDMLPLVRLRVNLSGGYERINSQRFGIASFADKVANPSSILTFTKAGKKSSSRTAADLLAAADVSAANTRSTVETEVTRILVENQGLTALPVDEMAEALRGFVDKGDKGSIKSTLERITKNVRKHVLSKAKEDDVHDLDNEFVDRFTKEWLLEQNTVDADVQQQDLDALLAGDEDDDDNDQEEEDEEEEEEEEDEDVDVKPIKRRAAAASKRTDAAMKKKKKKSPVAAVKRERRSRRSSRKKTINYDEEILEEDGDDGDAFLDEEDSSEQPAKRRASTRKPKKRALIDLDGDSDFGALVRNRKKK